MNTLPASSTIKRNGRFASPDELFIADTGEIITTARRSSGLVENGRRALVALAFIGFCCFAMFAMWYLVGQFQNGAYRAVVVFLIVIVVSNVASKYALWGMKN